MGMVAAAMAVPSLFVSMVVVMLRSVIVSVIVVAAFTVGMVVSAH